MKLNEVRKTFSVFLFKGHIKLTYRLLRIYIKNYDINYRSVVGNLTGGQVP